MKKLNLIGEKFGRLTVVKIHHYHHKSHSSYWVCICSCGSIKIVAGGKLRSGNTKSCGCLRRDLKIKHGKSNTKEYTVWQSMLSRCYYSRGRWYHRYGGRKILVCKRWHKFVLFLADMGLAPTRHTLERKNNNRGYSPSNCKWASQKEQTNNTSRNVILTFKRKSLTKSQWADKLGIKYTTINNRHHRGLTIEKILSPTKLPTHPIKALRVN